LPIELVRAGGGEVPQIGEIRNLSSGGVLFTADAMLRQGDSIEYVVTLPSSGEARALRLRCLGKVLRVDEAKETEETGSQFPFAIAATLERHEFLR
jgi:hypothetical protein